MTILQIWKLTGRLILKPVELPDPANTLDEATRQLPQGAYTTFRTFGRGRAVHLADHLNRLAETARLSGHAPGIDMDNLRVGLRQALADYHAEDARVRLVLDLTVTPGDAYLLLEPLQTPAPELYQRGVAVVTRSAHRENPKAKQTAFIVEADSLRRSLPEGAFEAVMVSPIGELLEGLSSNFFAVIDGELWTAEEGVLSGITRAMVLEEARQLGIPIHLQGVAMASIPGVEEAFITSASRAVLPVTRIDAATVGSGEPGPITRLLLERYNRRMGREAKPV
jgi:branched-chain amino acid aminotransferase